MKSFFKYKNVYFLGIGGIGMSGLARLLNSWGVKVSGSDIKASEITKLLILEGIEVKFGHRPENIPNDTELLIYTAAVREDNPEMIFAKKSGIKVISRGELLGSIMDMYPLSCAIAGTHGKTTVTAMIWTILFEYGADPTLMLGGIEKENNSNVYIGKGGAIISEACEYHDSFLNLSPKVGVILNTDLDHTDFFNSSRRLFSSYKSFAEKIPKNGYLIIPFDIKDIVDKNNIKTFGEYKESVSKDHYSYKNLKFSPLPEFDLFEGRIFLGHIKLKVPGEHNVKNALAASAAARACFVSAKALIRGLNKFSGVKRRLEYKGCYNEAVIYDDYAHHPTEITASLNALSNFLYNRRIVVFEPHTYSRTEAFFDGFVSSLSAADLVILSPVYGARENHEGFLADSEKLAEAINLNGTSALVFSNYLDIILYLKGELSSGDILITMGAGDVFLVSDGIIYEKNGEVIPNIHRVIHKDQ